MAQPDPSPTYVVLPAKAQKGETVLLFSTALFSEARQEAIRQTAATGVQHVIHTSTHYVDDISLWPEAAIDAIVLPIVPAVPEV